MQPSGRHEVMLRYKTETQPLQTTHKHTLGINVSPKVKRKDLKSIKRRLKTSYRRSNAFLVAGVTE